MNTKMAPQVVDRDTVLTEWDRVVFVNASAGPINITLPPSTAAGSTVRIVKSDQSGNVVTVLPAPGEELIGVSSIGGYGGAALYENVTDQGKAYCVIASPQVITGEATTGPSTGTTVLCGGLVARPERMVRTVWVRRANSDVWFAFDTNAGGGVGEASINAGNGSLTIYVNTAQFFSQPVKYRIEVW